MAEGKEPSFGRIVFGRAVSDTAKFFEYTKRDVVLAVVTLVLGAGLASVFVGKADTVKEIVFFAAFTLAPLGIVMLAVFAWHLWLAPSALAYEAAREGASLHKQDHETISEPQTTSHEKPVNWSIWRQKEHYDLKQFAAILARAEPAREGKSAERIGFLRLLQDDAMKGKLRVTRDRRAENYYQPDNWPAYFDVSKTDAIKWADEKNFDVAHIR